MQLSLPIHIDRRDLILSAPIERTYWMKINGRQTKIEVVGGKFRGESFIYILWLDRKIGRVQGYCGSSDNPDQRMRQHQRKWPLYRLTGEDIFTLALDNVGNLAALQGKTYRRKHTFLKAIEKAIGKEAAAEYKFLIFNAAKKHNTNGIIMAANQRGIGWHIARCFQADRSLEFAIKRQRKSLANYLPAHDVPF